MNKLILVLMTIALCSCGPAEYIDRTNKYKLPEEMKDCKIYRLVNDSGGIMTVVRCPMSATSTDYSSGKTRNTIIVIDGVKYVKESK